MQDLLYKNQNCDITRPYCFISYSSLDSYCVHSFVRQLIDKGFNVWIDWELENHIGTKWDETALSAIFDKNCKCIFWFVSEASCRSANVASELEYSQKDAVLHNHGGMPIKIYPLEVEEIRPDNNLSLFFDRLCLESDVITGNTINRIRNIFDDNKVKRLSIKKIFTDEGIDCLTESLNNDGWGDIVENPVWARFEDYFNRTLKNYSLQQVVDTILPELLPTLQKENEFISSTELINMICDADKEENYRIALKGNGGFGKSTLLIYIFEELISSKIPVVYVPLKELDQTQTFFDYTIRQLVPETTDFPPYIVDFLRHNSVLYLLDGLNEILPKNEKFIKEQIELVNRSNSIILTSRNDYKTCIKYKSVFDYARQYEIIPLTENVINDYLVSHGLKSVSGRLMELISSPLMLRLYVEQELFKNDQDVSEVEYLWKSEKNEGNLISNYLLLEAVRIISDYDTKKEYVLFSLLFFAPFLAWFMLKNNSFLLKEQFCNVAMTQFRKAYLQIFERIDELNDRALNREFIGSIPFPLDFYDNNTCTSGLFDILLNSGVLCKSDNEYYFCHQMFRDCLAAVHCLNSVYLSNREDVFALSEKVLSEDVLRFIADIDSDHKIDTYWRLLDKVFVPDKKSMTRMNLIRLFSLHNDNSLYSIDFSGKDLRNISLNSQMLSSGTKGARFCRAKISNATFSSPATHQCSITAITITDDFRYIISGDRNGTVIVYDTELSQAIMKQRYFTANNSAVKKITIHNSRLYIFYANGYSLSVDLNFEESVNAEILMTEQNDVFVDACFIFDELYIAFSHSIFRVNDSSEHDVVVSFEESTLNCIAFSEEDETIYCGLSDGSIAILDLLHEELEYNWLNPSDSVKSLILYEDSLYGLLADGKVMKWDVYSVEQDPSWFWDTSNAGEANIILLSGKGEYLFACSNDGDLIRVDSRTGKIQHSYQSGSQRFVVHAICISSDDAYLISDSPDNTPVIKDVKNTDNLLRNFSHKSSGPLYAINVSQNGKYAIAQNSTDTGIEYAVWDLEQGRICYVPVTLSAIWGKAKSISDDGSMLYLGQGEQFYCFDFEKELSEQENKPLEVYDGWMYALLIDEETHTVFMGVDDNRIYFVDLKSGTLKSVSPPFESAVNCFCADKHSDSVYVGYRNGTVNKIDKNGNVLQKYDLYEFRDWVNDICVSDNKTSIYVGIDNGYVIEINADTGEIKPVWHQKPKRRWDRPSISSVTVDNTNNCIVAVTGDCDVCSIDINDFGSIRSVKVKSGISHLFDICSFAQIKGSSCILVGDKEGDMHLYDTNEERIIRSYHRIANAFVVGCDFAKADFGGDMQFADDLRSSGGKM